MTGRAGIPRRILLQIARLFRDIEHSRSPQLGNSTNDDAEYLMKLNFHNLSSQDKSKFKEEKRVWLFKLKKKHK